MAFRSTGGNTIESNFEAVPSSSNSHPIDDVFDDLLGLEMPQSLVSNTAEQLKVSSPKEKKQKKDKRKKSKKKE
jgi:hypothetical protein